MELPTSVYGHDYYEALRLFRDQALENSHLIGRRRAFGPLSFGRIAAQWSTHDEGYSQLFHEGIRLGDLWLGDYPTQLNVFHRHSNGWENTTYQMEIDHIEEVSICRTMLTSHTFREYIINERATHKDRRHGVSAPTEEDFWTLYNELERGANGAFRSTHEVS